MPLRNGLVGSIPTLASLLNYKLTKGGGQKGDKFSPFDGVGGVSVDDEYHAHKSREQALYVLAFDEFEQKNVTPQQRRMLGSAAVPDIEDTRSRDSRRVSLGVLTDAAEGVSAFYILNMAEALEGTFDNPSPEMLAKMLGVSVDLVSGAVLDDWNPRPECLASVCKIFD